jgi:type IV secretory pathway VirB2 component (pilin)
MDNRAASGAGALSSLDGAIQWAVHVLTGSIGTFIAVLAVAGIGLMLLSGRVPARRAIGTIIGCFILFGSATIATALVDASQGDRTVAVVDPLPVTIPSPAPPPRPAPSYDPYAGASVPTRSVGGHDLFQ